MGLHTRSEPLSNKLFKISVVLLISGILFTAGQALGLESFSYFNTFTYADLLVSASLFIPFVFAVGLVCALLDAAFIVMIKLIRLKIAKQLADAFVLKLYVLCYIIILLAWLLLPRVFASLIASACLFAMLILNEWKKITNRNIVGDSFDWVIDKLTGKPERLAILGMLI